MRAAHCHRLRRDVNPRAQTLAMNDHHAGRMLSDPSRAGTSLRALGGIAIWVGSSHGQVSWVDRV
jgi:hypothetical protein